MIYAAVGAALFYFLRNDTAEFGIKARWPWILACLAAFGAFMALSHPELSLARYGAAFAVYVFLMTYAHGPILSPPWQPCSTTPDHIEKALMVWFYKLPGDKMGYPMWMIYAALRYVLPCEIIALAIGSPWYAVAGLVCVLGYWPIAYWLAKAEDTKFVGAAICGAAVFGGLGL
jgi:hypothetical protein